MTMDIFKVKGNNNLQVGGDLIINGSAPTSINRLLKLSYLALIIGLIGSVLPHDTINIFASIFTLAGGLAVGFFSWERRHSPRAPSMKKYQFAVGAVLIMSLMSGCAGPMLAMVPDPAISDLVHDYKSGVAQGVGIFGLGLNNINVQQAAHNGGITEVHFADKVRGYGLISYAKVSVFGE